MYTHISWSIEILVSFVSISPINSHRRLANTFSFVRVHTSITINMDIDSNLLLRLNNAGQGHLVSYWDQLDHEQRAILIRDIMNVDLDHVSQAFRTIMTMSISRILWNLFPSIEPVLLKRPVKNNWISIVTKVNQHEIIVVHLFNITFSLDRIGLKAIADGSVCVLLLAGGQGTRLGNVIEFISQFS
jgi:UDP-N-acetylglucosamine/UDP-N-acetylgalactosamine diphosphorylase